MSLFPLFFFFSHIARDWLLLGLGGRKPWELWLISSSPPPLRWPWASLICIVMEIGPKPREAQASCCTQWRNPVIFLLGGQGDYNLFEDLSSPCDNRSPNVNRQLWELKTSQTFTRGFHLHAHTPTKSSVSHQLGTEREKKKVVLK